LATAYQGFFIFKSDKKGDKMGDFFYSTLSYDRDKKNEREYRVQEGEPADTDLLHMDVVQLIGGRFFIGQNGRRTFPLSSVNSDVSNDDEGRQLHRRNGWRLESMQDCAR
jgi:hypothetical protein